jgi:hypothetical protein
MPIGYEPGCLAGAGSSNAGAGSSNALKVRPIDTRISGMLPYPNFWATEKLAISRATETEDAGKVFTTCAWAVAVRSTRRDGIAAWRLR